MRTPRRRHEFHEGERAVQERAGVSAEARQLVKMVLPYVPDGAAPFLAGLPFVIIGAPADGGLVWASIVSGEPGFLRVPDAGTLEIAATLAPGDPLAQAFDREPPVGVLAIELATRRRVRLNGHAERSRAGLLVKVVEFYGNCPSYIRPRVVSASATNGSSVPLRAARLSPEQVRWIGRADTFFIASRHPTRGADASHRGGPAGFVEVLGRSMLVFPDFPGNNMFNTLGNLSADPRVGLLFVDFETGRTLQVSGCAEI
ncbi:MAG TPA: pyridoxamine 5'-phosphate oxidase family protein, partial [Planctomycetota bacterium]|nr:pyridoxamine 5'-phosphate oxidase family protein [Planctomycetota bacterium]